MRIARIEKKQRIVSLRNGIPDKLEGSYGEVLTSRTPSDTYVELRKISKEVKNLFLRDVKEVFELYQIDFTSVSYGHNYYNGMVQRAIELSEIENAHRYASSYIDALKRISLEREKIAESMSDVLRYRILGLIEKKYRDMPNFAKSLSELAKKMMETEKKSDYPRQKFFICQNHTILFYVELIGWITIKI